MPIGTIGYSHSNDRSAKYIIAKITPPVKKVNVKNTITVIKYFFTEKYLVNKYGINKASTNFTITL